MRSSFNHQIGQRAFREGLTTLEFLGCVTAVLGGAWIGALYLGVNVQHLAHTALEQAQLLDSIPEQWRPEGPKDNAVTRAQLVATLRKEIGVLRTEIRALHSGDSTGTTQTLSDELATAKAKTKSYWQRLNEIAWSEESLQRDAQTALDGSNSAKVYAIKGRVSRFAAKSIEAAPTEGVDESVLKFGRHLLLWYDKSGELYENAVQIWETPDTNGGRAQLTEDWKRAETQHRQEARLLRDRATAVRGTISRRFGEEFPAFGAPPAAEVSTEKPAPPATTG
jgi:hypothetical protein